MPSAWKSWPARPPLRTGHRRAAGAVLAATVALAVAGCGSDEAEDAGPNGDEVVDVSGAEPVGEELAGSVAPLAQCRDWVKGTKAEKLATIEDIRSQINLEDTGIDAPPLTDEEALDVFNGACSQEFASGFRLYVLYARAAGFAPLTREP